MINSSFANRLMEVIPEESRLVRQAKSGDADAFVKLYEAYVDRVYRYIYFRVADDKIADSITPHIFIKAWHFLDQNQPFGSSFIAWLFKIASDQVTEYLRAHPRTAPRSDKFLWSVDDGIFDENIKDMFDLQAMRDALQFLTDEEQQVLTLKFIAGLSTDNIARIMAMPASAIHALLMQALKTVSRYMDEKEIT